MSVSTIIFLTMLIVLLTVCRKYLFNFVKFRKQISKLPSLIETSYPFVGHSHLLAGSATHLFHFITKALSAPVAITKQQFSTVWFGPVPFIFIVHPDAAEVILRSSKHMTKSFVYRFLHPWLGTGLLTSTGEKWKQRRRLITPSFHFNILQDFLDVMNEQSQVMINTIAKQYDCNKNVDLGKAVTLCALDIICETAMGQSVNAQANSDSLYVKALYRISDLIQLRQKTPIFWWDYGFKKLSVGMDHDEALKTLHTFTRNVIDNKLNNKRPLNEVSKKMAFLDVLVHAITEDGQSLSPADIQEEVDTFMFEGHDTTAAAMTWALYLIGRHSDVQKRIQDELNEVFGEDVDRPASMEDLRKCLYLEQVIKEALRLFPSVPFFGRVTSEDCTIDGFTLPQGTQVVVSVYNVHHNPEVWNNPEKFDPDRFTKENSAGRHPFAYLPFSAGPRNCIGQKFALLEEKVILSQILRRFNIVSHDKREDLKMVGDLILRPAKPLHITLSKRSE